MTRFAEYAQAAITRRSLQSDDPLCPAHRVAQVGFHKGIEKAIQHACMLPVS